MILDCDLVARFPNVKRLFQENLELAKDEHHYNPIKAAVSWTTQDVVNRLGQLRHEQKARWGWDNA